MLGRVTAANIRHYSTRLRHHLVKGVGTLRHVGGSLDHAYQVGRTVYQSVQPLLKELAPALEGQTTKILKGVGSGYEYLRDKAAAVESVGNQIQSNLKKKGLSPSKICPTRNADFRR